jgi:hypothetical protein
VDRTDRQRPELVEREAAVQVFAGHFFDPVQLRLLVGVGGLLPGAGTLKRDLVTVQQLP